LPIIHLPVRLKIVGWVYVSLIPLYLYYKSVFSLFPIFGKDIQWPILVKDITGLIIVLSIIPIATQKRRQILSSVHWKASLLLFCFSIYYFIIGMISENGILRSIMGARGYTFYAIVGIFLGALLLREVKDFLILKNILMIICILISILALIHRYIDEDFLIHPEMKIIFYGELYDWYTYEERLRSFFMSPNTLGIFMALGILLCTWTLVKPKSDHFIMVAPIALCLFSWVLILTRSRTALVAVFLSTILMVSIVQPRLVKIFITISAVLLISVITYTAYSDRLDDLIENPRLPLWKAYINSTLSDGKVLTIGHGVASVGRFGTETVVADLEMEEVLELLGKDQKVFFVDNYFVQCFYETGLFGLLMIIWILWLWWQSYRFLKGAGLSLIDKATLAIPVSLMFLVLIISLLTGALGTYPWNFLYWLLASGMLFVIKPMGRVAKTEK